MSFYSVSECRIFLEKLCAEFTLCPKYCHLQTNVTSCFNYHLQNCKGVCVNKEDITTYNNRVQKAIASIGFEAKNMVIKETGRNEDEIGFTLILGGSYKGFGYIDKAQAEALKEPEDYQFFLQPKRDNRDIQRILKAYLRKNTKEKQEENGEISI